MRIEYSQSVPGAPRAVSWHRHHRSCLQYSRYRSCHSEDKSLSDLRYLCSCLGATFECGCPSCLFPRTPRNWNHLVKMVHCPANLDQIGNRLPESFTFVAAIADPPTTSWFTILCPGNSVSPDLLSLLDSQRLVRAFHSYWTTFYSAIHSSLVLSPSCLKTS